MPKAGAAEQEAIADVLRVMGEPVVKKVKQAFRRSPSIGSNHSGTRLMLEDGSAVEAPGGTGSSSCMEVDQMESTLAAIQGLVQARW